MKRIVLSVVLLVVLCCARGAASEALENVLFIKGYNFWRAVNNTHQYYATGTRWGGNYLGTVTDRIISDCSQYVTPIDRPFKNGWNHDFNVKNHGLPKGWIFSRNVATGSKAQNIKAAESCMINAFQHTFPTAGVSLLAFVTFIMGGWVVAAGVLFAVVVVISFVLAGIWVYGFLPVISCGKWIGSRLLEGSPRRRLRQILQPF